MRKPEMRSMVFNKYLDYDVESGDVVKVYGLSSDAADNSVDGDVKWFSIGYPNAADVAAISGDSAAADNLKVSQASRPKISNKTCFLCPAGAVTN